MSPSKSCGEIPSAAAPIEGSTKCRVTDFLIAAFERKFGFQEGIFSTTNKRSRALIKEAIVATSSESSSFAITSSLI